MILDHIDRHDFYAYGDAWDVAFDFLLSLKPDAEEKRYTLQGDLIYAAIESYETQPAAVKRPEAHRKYVDIQVLLAGVEQIAWWPIEGLAVAEPYVADRDIMFFEQPGTPGTMLDLAPGGFAVFFPHDAHMPGLQIADPCYVKKVVVKIAADLLPDLSSS